MDYLITELKEISKNIINKPYFYNVFLYIVNNTKYDIELLKLYCQFVEKYDDYNENDKHILYNVNIQPFINSFKYCNEHEKINLKYYEHLNYIYNNIIQVHFNIPIITDKIYNIPKEVYHVLYFIFDNNEFYLARNLALSIFKNK